MSIKIETHPMTLKVYKCSKNLEEGHLKEIFGKFGKVLEVKRTVKESGMKDHIMYVNFEKYKDMERAYCTLNQAQIDGQRISIEFIDTKYEEIMKQDAELFQTNNNAQKNYSGNNNDNKNHEQDYQQMNYRKQPMKPEQRDYKRSPSPKRSQERDQRQQEKIPPQYNRYEQSKNSHGERRQNYQPHYGRENREDNYKGGRDNNFKRQEGNSGFYRNNNNNNKVEASPPSYKEDIKKGDSRSRSRENYEKKQYAQKQAYSHEFSQQGKDSSKSGSGSPSNKYPAKAQPRAPSDSPKK